MIRKTKNLAHLLIGHTVQRYYKFPAKGMVVIGITGTDGKTTTANLIFHMLKSAGKKVALISTTGAAIGDKTYPLGFHVTTPSSFSLLKYIALAKKEHCTHLVLEVTSHGLDQNRVAGIKFDIGVITNVTHEHLDYHKTYDQYVKTKFKLLMRARVCIVNRDDESFEILSNLKSQSQQKRTERWITYGMVSDADITPAKFDFEHNLTGEFNTYNILASIAVCREIGIEDASIRDAIKTFIPPRGRQEVVYDREFKVMIDFAHTPNSFEKILSSLRKTTKGRIIHVFGSAGKRDASKRPLMGDASSKYADQIILTAEDPRGEDVEKINREIEVGIKKKNNVLKIEDRKKAIEHAISQAKKEDLVLITGKAHEKSMNYGNGEVAWDEFEIVRGALKNHEK